MAPFCSMLASREEIRFVAAFVRTEKKWEVNLLRDKQMIARAPNCSQE
jgi:hypothetical protein